jgi:hypothetical protein
VYASGGIDVRICDLIGNQDTYQADIGQTVLETVRAMVERNIGAVRCCITANWWEFFRNAT